MYLICEQILTALSSKPTQNPTISYHLHYYYFSVYSTIISCLDYCNNLQVVFLLLPLPFFSYAQCSHYSDPAKNLDHFPSLPKLSLRVKVKVLKMIYKTLYDLAPCYLWAFTCLILFIAHSLYASHTWLLTDPRT